MESRYQLHHGDCLEVLKTLPDCSVDAVVTDPPYGLSFMGKRWDYDVRLEFDQEGKGEQLEEVSFEGIQ